MFRVASGGCATASARDQSCKIGEADGFRRPHLKRAAERFSRSRSPPWATQSAPLRIAFLFLLVLLRIILLVIVLPFSLLLFGFVRHFTPPGVL